MKRDKKYKLNESILIYCEKICNNETQQRKGDVAGKWFYMC